jgi:hypothetical protein
MITFILCAISYVTIGFVVGKEATIGTKLESDEAIEIIVWWPFILFLGLIGWVTGLLDYAMSDRRHVDNP